MAASKKSSSSHTKMKWGYDHQGGECLRPSEWPKYYATGKHQSPINILVGCEPNQLNTTCCAYDTSCSPDTCSSQLIAQFRDELKVATVMSNAKSIRNNHRHLNSTGEDQRSPSTSSVASSVSSAFGHLRGRVDSVNSYGCKDDDDDDDYEIDDDNNNNNNNEDDYNDQNGNNIQGNNKQPHLYQNQNQNQKEQQVACYQNTRHCISNKKIFLGYPRYLSHMSLCNTGHNWQVNFAPEVMNNTLLCGPPFGEREYRLAQFHAHWGKDCDQGSEHRINGRGFAAELHFVHWNCSQFNSMEEAARHQHGLAVLGVLVQAVNGERHRNKHLDKLIAGMSQIREPESEVQIQPRLDLKKLFPSNRWVYASYEGSLTTPPLSEVVDWVVFLSPITCSKSQIEQFKQIKCHSSSGGCKQLIDNCRPIQPVNSRMVSIWTHH